MQRNWPAAMWNICCGQISLQNVVDFLPKALTSTTSSYEGIFCDVPGAQRVAGRERRQRRALPALPPPAAAAATSDRLVVWKGGDGDGGHTAERPPHGVRRRRRQDGASSSDITAAAAVAACSSRPTLINKRHSCSRLSLLKAEQK